jgi:hypothetical protein
MRRDRSSKNWPGLAFPRKSVGQDFFVSVKKAVEAYDQRFMPKGSPATPARPSLP